MRKPDRPGSFRVSPKGGRYLVSGVRPDGQRVKVWAASQSEGDAIGKNLFGNSSPSIGPILQPQPQATREVDEWGFPIKVSPEVAASVAASFGIKPTAALPVAPPVVDKEEQEKKERRAKNAKSLMELAGVGYAAGTVMVSKKWVRGTRNNEPVKANPRQVNDLADCTRDTFVEMFGDRDIKPWHMMLLLTLGIPLSMWLQTPQLPKSDEKKEGEPTKLKSVP